MSIKLTSAIFETEFRDLPLGETNAEGKERMAKASSVKITMLAIADHANDEGEGAYPGLTKLELKTGLSRQGVVDVLKAIQYNGLAVVSDEPSKLNTNSYTINLASFPKLQDKEDKRLLVKPLDQSSHLTSASQVTLPEVVKPLDLNHPLTTQKPYKKGDLLDGVLHYGKQALDKGMDKVEEVIQALERGLKVNITRSLSNQQIAKKILNDGRPLDQWLSWVKSDPWRAARLYMYADLNKVWRDFPQAFIEGDGYNPQGMEIGF